MSASSARLRIRDRYSLPVFSARAYSEPEVSAYHIDIPEHLQSVPHHRRVLYHRSDSTFFNYIPFRYFKHEISAHRIDLPAAHLDDEDPVVDGGKDLAGSMFSRHDHRIAHTRYRPEPVRFTPAVACWRHRMLHGMEPVKKVIPENPVFDKDRPL